MARRRPASSHQCAGRVCARSDLVQKLDLGCPFRRAHKLGVGHAIHRFGVLPMMLPAPAQLDCTPCMVDAGDRGLSAICRYLAPPEFSDDGSALAFAMLRQQNPLTAIGQ